jgi:ABC-2 type transport system permease protein
VRRYLELLRVQAKASLLLALQYRFDFFLQALLALFWSATSLVPLFVLFGVRKGVAGWSADEMLVVVGFFTLLKGVLSAVIQPSLTQAVDHIRKGTLDFLLLKPADAQFTISTARFELAHFADVLAGLGIAAWALARVGHTPSLADLTLVVALLACALAILYGMWIFVVSLAFRFVKLDNMNYLFVSLFEAARWPSSVFRGALSVLFTFVIPLALMTTYPALALLGRASAHHVITTVVVASCVLALSRFIWLRSIRQYTGAGG